MSEYIFTNNAESELAIAMGGADVTLQVTAGDGALFPSPGSDEQFKIMVRYGSQFAYMLGTGRASDVITVTRTDQYSFPIGSTVRLVIDADVFGSFIQKSAYRTSDGSPDGVLTTDYVGEEVLDTTNNLWYKSVGGTTWKLMSPE